MASIIYNEAKGFFADGTVDWDTDDIRIALLMTNTTADTENDTIHDLADFTTLDECDATGYARQALTAEAVNIDDANDRAELDGADASFTGLSGDATRDIQGALVFKYVDGTAANDLAIAFIDFTTDVPKTATQIDVPWNVEGLIQLS